jgi:hypothetical protein
MAQNQNVNIKATVSVDDSSVKQYNNTLDQTQQKTEAAFNPKKALKEAKLALIEAQQAFGTYSEEAVKAARRVAELQDQIQDANETAALFDPGKKFQAYSNALQSAAGAFAGVQGAIGLLGVESEKVNEQLLKVQSALALSEGLSTIGDIGKNFGQLATVIKSQVVGAFQALKAAIGSTGIGLLVIALGTIAAYWDDIKAAVSGVNEEQKKGLADAKQAADLEEKKLEDLDLQDNVLKLQGKSEKDILKLKVEQLNKVIETRKAELEKNRDIIKGTIEAEKRNNKFLQSVLRVAIEASLVPLRILAAPIDLLLKTVNSVSESLGLAKVTAINLNDEINKLAAAGTKKVADFVFDAKKTEAEGAATIAAAERSIKVLESKKAGFQLSLQSIDKQGLERRSKDVSDDEEKRLKAEEEAYKKRKERLEGINDEITENRKKQIRDVTNAEINELPKVLSARLNIIRTEEQLKEDQARLDRARFEEAMARETAFQDTLRITGDTFVKLGEIVGKQTAAGKALAVAQALINTYQGITQIWANKTTIPEPFGTIQKVAATITAAASGFAAVKGIVRTSVPGGGGGGGNVPAGAGGAAPISPQAPQAITTQLSQQSVNQLGTMTARAYVVESDVSNSQERIRRINRAATFG